MTFGVDAQVQFATEFALFLVAIAGLALSLLRPELLTRSQAGRLALAVAFASLAGAAFIHGSLLVSRASDPVVLTSLTVGWLALLAGASQWDGGRVSQRVAVVAVVIGLAGAGATLLDADTASAALRALAAVALGGALLNASRRAIATRVAASAAATLLLVVLVLSVGLSAVLSNTVEDQAISAVDGRAVREASLVEGARTNAIQAARFTSSAIAGSEEFRNILLAIDDTGSPTPEQADKIRGVLDGLSGFFLGQNVQFAYADKTPRVIAPVDATAAPFVELLGTDAAEEARTTRQGAGDVVVLGERAVAIGVVPVDTRSPQGQRALGLVLAAVEIDAAYLEDRSRAEEAVNLSTWARGGPIASVGPQPEPAVVATLVDEVLSGEETATRTTSSRFVAARAVRSQTDRPLFALVASRSTSAVDEIRERLFRTFFVIAFGGTLLALLLAAVVGDRIGAGVRLLTRSVEALERGETGVRSDVRTDDEVGRLGTAFDAMAMSIEDKTAALRQAALDEAALRNRVEAIIAGMGEALVATDRDGKITDFNEAAEDLLGVAADAVKGRNVVDVVRLHNEDGVELRHQLTSDEGVRWSELGEVDGAGGPVPVAVTAGPLRGADGELAGRVLVFRDLRSEREVERMKREFLSRVGHELRTPLTPLLGYARIFAGRAVPPERARDLGASMVSSGERLERIIEMLEFFASAQAGETVLRPQPVDLRDLLTELVDGRQKSSPNGHVLVRRVRTGTPQVVADPYWLRRSIDELLDNAIKFSPNGGRVSVTAAPVEGFVEISVRDTGVGMSEDEVERAFAEWSQGDESDTRAYGGLGLGLALVQRVAERHGGRVSCETAPGKGSKFSILLPVLPTEESDASRPRPRAARRDGAHNGDRVHEADDTTG